MWNGRIETGLWGLQKPSGFLLIPSFWKKEADDAGCHDVGSWINNSNVPSAEQTKMKEIQKLEYLWVHFNLGANPILVPKLP